MDTCCDWQLNIRKWQEMEDVSDCNMKTRNVARIKNPEPDVPVPCRVVIIAGFLGSGKTTLLKRLLDWEIDRGMRPYVIMSEFGDLDIDGVLISDRKIELTTITGGCACCDLRAELSNIFSRVVNNSTSSIVFIESTGVGDPAGILEAIGPVLKRKSVVVANIVVVYDSSRHPFTGKDGELVRRQLKTADTIVVNKCDRLSPLEIQKVVSDISEVNQSAEVVTTVQCSVDIEKILTGYSNIKPEARTASTSDTFRTLGFLIESPLSRKLLERWLKSLPPSVVRAKGFVELDEQKGLFEVQATRGQVSITSLMTGVRPQAMIVLVTHPMRTDGLLRGLKGCVAGFK
jgi:G3E family GTPase